MTSITIIVKNTNLEIICDKAKQSLLHKGVWSSYLITLSMAKKYLKERIQTIRWTKERGCPIKIIIKIAK